MEDNSIKKSWASLTSEQEIEDLLRLPSYAEFFGTEENLCSQDTIRSFPSPILASRFSDEVSSSISTPVYGDPNSPFAPSSKELNELREYVEQNKTKAHFQEYSSADDATFLRHKAEVQPNGFQIGENTFGVDSSSCLLGFGSRSCERLQLPYQMLIDASSQLQNTTNERNDWPWNLQSQCPASLLAMPNLGSNECDPTLFTRPPSIEQLEHNSMCFASLPAARDNLCTQFQSAYWMDSLNKGIVFEQCGVQPSVPLQNLHSCVVPQFSYNVSQDQLMDKPHTGHSQIQGSKKLAEFRRRKGHGYKLSDALGMIADLSRDQVGSRFLQREIPRASHEVQKEVFLEIKSDVSTIANDVFGNFVIQKLLEFGNSEVITSLVEIVKPQVLQFSIQKYSCRVLQKCIEAIPYDFKIELAIQLDGHVAICSKDEYANHVIQRCIQHLKAEHIGFIYQTIAENTSVLSMHPYGCRVVQRAIERSNRDTHVRAIIQEIIINVVLFAFDPFANFVVQHLLRQGSSGIVDAVVKALLPHIIELSCDKYPSNVVEVCLSVCNAQDGQHIKSLVLGTMQQTHSNVLETLICDPFGRFVVEKIIKMCSIEEKWRIKNTSVSIIEHIRHNPRQRSLMKRIEKLLSSLAI